MEGSSRQMAAPRIHEFFDRQIKEYARNRRELKPPAIRRLLETNIKYGTLQPPDDLDILKIPSAKTIGRRLIEFRNQPEAEQQQYDWFRWPECALDGRLPWESSETLINLLRYLQQQRNEQRNKQFDPKEHFDPKHFDPNTVWADPVWADNRLVRPTVSQAWWFWRLTQAAPKTSIPDRWQWVQGLTFNYNKPEHLEAMKRSIEGAIVQKTYLTHSEAPPESTALEAAVESHFAWVPVEQPPKQKKGTAHGRQRKTKGR
jgi:hypothetical protein